MKHLPERMTIRECYGPAMKIRTSKAAQAYLKRLVDRSVRYSGRSPEEALSIELQNLGYYAGYYDAATMKRVYRLFGAAHPIFGTSVPSARTAFKAGRAAAHKRQR